MDNVLPAKCGNTAEQVVSVQVSRGTTLFEGIVGPQGGLLGGGNRVFIRNVIPFVSEETV